jgi:hypothetical protein
MSEQPIFDVMQKFFKDDEWPITQLEGKPILRTAFKGDNGQWACFAQARDDRQQFIFYSVCQTNTPAPKRAAMAEFLTRANYGLIIGNFEMDFSDGEVRYKTSIDVENDRLTTPLVKSLVYANVSVMDRYLPGIMALMYNDDTTPEAEIRKIEG